MSDQQSREWFHEPMAGDHGPAASIIDAAHATSPAAGQGASMAIEDAVILAQCLRDCPDSASAFMSFVALRRKRVEKIVKNGHRGSNSKAAGPLGRLLRDSMLPLIFKQAEKDSGASMMWLQGHHIDFEKPIHPSLNRP